MGQEESLLSEGTHLSSDEVRVLAKKYQSWRAPDRRQIKASEDAWLGDFLARVFARSATSLTESAQAWISEVSNAPTPRLTLSQVLAGTAPEQVVARKSALRFEVGPGNEGAMMLTKVSGRIVWWENAQLNCFEKKDVLCVIFAELGSVEAVGRMLLVCKRWFNAAHSVLSQLRAPRHCRALSPSAACRPSAGAARG